MNKFGYGIGALLGVVLLLSFTGSAHAQNAATAGTPARMLVTVEARHGSDVPDVGRVDVMVFEGHDRDQVTDWVPAQGDNGALELFILLDDGSSLRLGSQLEDIRRFIDAQPGFAKIGVAYMQNGIAKVQQDLTTDHAAAGKALRLPMGIAGINGSPYFSLSDLIKRWPQSSARREVLMVTDGIDRYYGGGSLEDPYLNAAINDAQRAGIIVYGIYTPGSGRSGRRRRGTNWGQMYLSSLTEESGGESYYIGFTGSAVEFRPYLDELGHHLEHQYWLTFNAKPQKKSGWQKVKVMTEVSNAKLVAAHQVYVSAAAQ